jgi:hypothetical protein
MSTARGSCPLMSKFEERVKKGEIFHASKKLFLPAGAFSGISWIVNV